MVEKIGNELPNYKKPPVIEVACGIIFPRIMDFKTTHFGLFWNKIREQFPIVEQAAPLQYSTGEKRTPENPEILLDLIPPLPRTWFINERKDALIQLQKDLFFYNWRKMGEEESYPRYIKVIETFKAYFTLFRNFLKEEKLPNINPSQCELTYINHIPKGEGWETVSDINNVLNDLNWGSKNNRFFPEPQFMNWQTGFELPNKKGRLHVKLDFANRKTDNQPLFILEITVRGLGEDRSEDAIWDWFDLAHVWIVKGFADLTNLNTQKMIWERDV
ncbi:MAG: TIGR04255 family protein [Desulfobacteraceae bacterium]|nr:MAG: TIGR04255 family protein [Desulfobacteraceae bacterium]